MYTCVLQLVDEFMQAVTTRYPNAVIQFEVC